MTSKPLWSGRFDVALDKQVLGFTTSLGIDSRMWEADIDASIAHVNMLGRQKILSHDEALAISLGLALIKSELKSTFEAGGNPFAGSDAEDIHSVIEDLLKEKIGPVAGKLHTARSRNDQVATSFRLHVSRELTQFAQELRDLQQHLVTTAEKHINTVMPGRTHFQHAQPISLAHHLLAYFWMFERDFARLEQIRERTLSLPLGSAALAGTSFPLDRGSVAAELGFHELCENSLDAVSDRDFVVEFLSAAALVMTHLSRMAEEFILWTSPEMGYLTLADSVTTGSSIMPQKKNPDVAELIRGRVGRVQGALVGALTMLKALPLAYNRDLQEDKTFFFDGLDVARSCTRLTSLMLMNATFHPEKLSASLAGDFSNATDLADTLAKKGVAFRDAHEIVGKLVRDCLTSREVLESLDLVTLRTYHKAFDEADLKALAHESVMAARTSEGGTSPSSVELQLERARIRLK